MIPKWCPICVREYRTLQKALKCYRDCAKAGGRIGDRRRSK